MAVQCKSFPSKRTCGKGRSPGSSGPEKDGCPLGQARVTEGIHPGCSGSFVLWDLSVSTLGLKLQASQQDEVGLPPAHRPCYVLHPCASGTMGTGPSGCYDSSLQLLFVVEQLNPSAPPHIYLRSGAPCTHTHGNSEAIFVGTVGFLESKEGPRYTWINWSPELRKALPWLSLGQFCRGITWFKLFCVPETPGSTRGVQARLECLATTDGYELLNTAEAKLKKPDRQCGGLCEALLALTVCTPISWAR